MGDLMAGRASSGSIPPYLQWIGLAATGTVGAIGIWAVGQLLGPRFEEILMAALLMFWLVYCMGGMAEDDPVGYLSIAAPAFLAVAATILLALLDRDALGIVALGCLWIGAWVLFSSRLWPWWSRVVLRRRGPESPQMIVWRASTDVFDALENWDKNDGNENLRAARQRLRDVTTAQTERYADGVSAAVEFAWMDHVPPEILDRLSSRMAMEGPRMWRSDRIRMPWVRPGPRDRPTAGSRLEYMFPTLEAIVAAAHPADQRRMAVAALRVSALKLDVSDEDVDSLLSAMENGRVDRSASEALEERAEALFARTSDDQQKWARATLLDTVAGATRDDNSSRDFSDTIATAVWVTGDYSNTPDFEAALRVFVPEGTRLQPVEVDPTDENGDSPERSLVGRSRQRGFTLRLVALAFVAGVSGVMADELVWRMIEGTTLETSGVEFLARSLVTLLVVFGGVGAMRILPSLGDVLLIILAYAVAGYGAILVASGLYGVGFSFEIVPWALLNGLAFAVVLGAGLWLVRGTSPRLKQSQPSPT